MRLFLKKKKNIHSHPCSSYSPPHRHLHQNRPSFCLGVVAHVSTRCQQRPSLQLRLMDEAILQM